MKDLKCSVCNGDLTLDLTERVVPCKDCLQTERGEGFSEGMDRGYENGYNDLLNTVFKGIFKLGYETCYMKLTNDYAPEWVLQFAAEDAEQEYIPD